MLGLTTALRLAQRGDRVTVLESAQQLGGLASPWTLGDLVWDRFYHVTLLSDQHLRRLLRDLRLEDSMEWRITRTGCFVGGQTHSVSSSLEFLKFPALSLVDKLRLAATVFRASKIHDSVNLEKVLVEDWLTRWSGASAFETFWKPLLRSKLGDDYRRTSAAFIWATISRLYAARRSGLKREMFGYVRGGYARVIERFADSLQELGVDLRPGFRVEEIRTNGRGVSVSQADGEPVLADQAVITVAPPLVPGICPQLSSSEASRLRNLEYLGVVCASMLTPAEFGGFYVTNLLDESLPFTGLIEMSALVDRQQFGGRTLLYMPKYLSGDDPLFQSTDQEIRQLFLGALERMFPQFKARQADTFQVARNRHVFPVPVLGYSSVAPPVTTSVPGVSLLNSAQIINGTLNVNETVLLAEKGVRQLIERYEQTAPS